jgi:hypothetical protein
MISVVCWLWRQPGYRTPFGTEHVNALRRMVARHYRKPHRFLCVTDIPDGLESGIEVVPLDGRFADLPNPSCRGGPSCYRRLRLFAREAAAIFGDRIVSLDLDTVIVADMAPIWDRPEPILLWRDPLFHNVRYNGSMIILDAGAAPQVWERFDPASSIGEAKAAGLFGSDQAIISHILGPDVPTVGREEGVYSFRLMDDPKLRPRAYTDLPTKHDLPGNARIIFFHGGAKPWDENVRSAYPWVAEHWK